MADEHHDPLPASFRVLGRHEAAAVPELWNSAWQSVTQGHNPYPLSAALWGERLESRHHDQELLWGGFVADELVAVAYGKLPKSDWQTPGVGWLALLAVEPEVQGRRLGTRLAAHLLRALAERGATVVKFGGEADHLLPGPPQESAPAVWRLLRRFGAKFGPAEHDLHLDLRPELPPAPLPAGWRLRTDDPAGAVAYVTDTFPGRWSEELADYVASGATAMTLERVAESGTSGSAEVKGFCAVFPGGELVTSPGLIWAPSLRSELAANGGQVSLAGIGPLGISQEVRGANLGLALVRGAADYARRRGATDLIINWTTLTGFYGRLGARLWRTFQRVEAPMPSAATLSQLTEGVDVDHEPQQWQEGSADVH